MSKEEFILLATKVADNTASLEELGQYNAICDSLQSEQISWPGMDEQLPLMEILSLEKVWKQKPGSKLTNLWPRIAAAASIVLAVTAGGYYFFHSPSVNQGKQNLTVKSDILPGKNTATLTFSSGKIVSLKGTTSGITIKNTSIAYNDGAPLLPGQDSLKKTGSKTEQLIAATPKGGQYQVVLPDGTRVWLNADSKLQFPDKFIGKERRVTLTGEAYFEVAHNSRQPFRVESEGQFVEDIGTAFNINSYPDEKAVKTTLIQGSASVKSTTSDNIVLKPGQQAILLSGNIKVSAANIRSVLDWKNGKFVFDEESLASIMRKVSRWYNVEVIYDGADPEKKFGGSISRFENVSKVLEKLELTGAVHFQVDGRKIYVRK